MKTLKYILSFVFSLMTTMLYAQDDKVTFSMLEGTDPTTWNIDVNFENAYSGNYTAFQMDISLPEGAIVQEAKVNSMRTAGHILSFNKQSDGAYRLIGYSTSNAEIKGNSGAMCTLVIGNVKAPQTRTGYTLDFSNVIFTKRDGIEVATVASESAQIFSIVYKIDNKEYRRQAVQCGSPLTLLAPPVKEGHTFSGWSEHPVVMPNNNVEVSGDFSVNEYNLTFKVDGVLYGDPKKVKYGSQISLPEPPVKEGHTFGGWDEVPATMPAHDIEINGKFTINSYTLEFWVDGECYHSSQVQYGAKIVLPEDPVKKGATFKGWGEVPEFMPARNLIINGTFLNKYKLTLKVDGEVYKTYYFAEGENVQWKDPDPVREGYTFSGWKNMPKTMPAMDVVVDGSFIINTYTLVFKVDGKIYKSVNYEYKAKIILPESPSKEGHTFGGWSENLTYMPARNVEVNALFSVNTYKLILKLDGSVHQTLNVNYGAEIILPEAPVKTEHDFCGWSDVPVKMPAKDIVVEGFYTYWINYEVDGMSYGKPQKVKCGDNIVLYDVPVKEGHAFSGWSDVPELMPAEDLTVKGVFCYALSYEVEGKVLEVVQVRYGEKIVAKADPVKKGHQFTGWKNLPKTMPANDVVVTGSFAVNSYFVHYYVDGMEYTKTLVPYGDKITLPENPVKEGHTFGGWKNVPIMMPDHEVEISGEFVVNIYTITYILNGEVYDTQQVAFGEVIEPLVVEDTTGQTFLGWKGLPEKMPAHDVTVHGDTEITGIVFLCKDKLVKVYTPQGKSVLIDVTWSEAKRQLLRGLYIVNGQKIYVK